MLVTPAATARLVSADLRTMVVVALGIAVASAVGGLYVSYFRNTAPGATIVLVATGLFALAWLGRGVSSRLAR